LLASNGVPVPSGSDGHEKAGCRPRELHVIYPYEASPLRGPACGATKEIGLALCGTVIRTGTIFFVILGRPLKGVKIQIRSRAVDPDRLPDIMDARIESIMDREDPEDRKARSSAVREQWLRVATGRPILQRRIWQAISDLEEAVDEDTGVEKNVLERWAVLTEQQGPGMSGRQ